MSNHKFDRLDLGLEGMDEDGTRSLLDKLLSDSRLYKTSEGYRELMEFVVRLRNFAPFNAMLLQIQKPGLRFAASEVDWRTRFGRRPKEGARPLLILWPFGPVALVYDEMDTEGKALPEDVTSYFASGSMNEAKLDSFRSLIGKKGIEWIAVDAGDMEAGLIRVVRRAANDREKSHYRIHVNRNHEAPAKFITLAHELGHLFLGHLGPDKYLNIPRGRGVSHALCELEAESVAYIVGQRNGVTSKSQVYLSGFVNALDSIDHLDIYQIMRAAGQVESLLGLVAKAQFD